MSTLLTKRGRDRIPKNVSGDSAFALGGTITQINGMTIHTFLANGTFLIAKGIKQVNYLVVGAGGYGGPNGRGGGGGGQVLQGALAVDDGSYAITIGQSKASWSVNNSPGGSEQQSVFSTVTANGGNDGGDPAGGTDYAAGGNFQTTVGTNGANGTTSSISGVDTVYGGGGGGAGRTGSSSGGNGGGGAGNVGAGTAGTANTGGGGGGGGSAQFGGAGGTGIVIISYPTP